MKFGAQSECQRLRLLLLHRPQPADLKFVTPATLKYYNFGEPVDPEKFLSDYDKMVDAFVEQGVEPVFLADVLKDNREAMDYISRRPNLVYMRDMASVFNDGAVVMNPFLKGRQWDGWVVAECFKKMGIPVLGEIEYPGYLEGGGVGFLSERVGYVSICDRANEEAILQLASFTLGSCLDSLLVVNLPDGYVHIDGLVMPLDEKAIFVHRPVIDVSPTRVLHASGKMEYAWFPDYVARLGFEVIDSPYGYDLNYVAYKPKEFIGYDFFSENIAVIKKRGGKVIGIPGAELKKGNGGVHCMTCPILRK